MTSFPDKYGIKKKCHAVNPGEIFYFVCAFLVPKPRLGNALAGEAPASRDGRRPEAGAWERGKYIRLTILKISHFLCRTHVKAGFKPALHKRRFRLFPQIMFKSVFQNENCCLTVRSLSFIDSPGRYSKFITSQRHQSDYET